MTFNDEKVAVNVACLRKLPEVEYVQFLVNPREKKLAVKITNWLTDISNIEDEDIRIIFYSIVGMNF